MPLSQNPHKPTTPTDNILESAIGRQMRMYRKANGFTVADLSARTGISVGMLSKIENGNTSPSLTTLQTLSHALQVPITAFFRGYERKRGVMHVKAGQGVEADRAGTRAGHQYSLLGHIGGSSSGVIVEPYLITLTESSDTFPTFQHEGMEFIHMIEGIVGYKHGDKVFRLEPGDSLFFDADAPHGPEVLTQLPAKYLSIIAYAQPE